MLLRLFNDDTPLVNLSKGWVGSKGQNGEAQGGLSNGQAASAKPVEDATEAVASEKRARNSSSPEPENEAELGTGEAYAGDAQMSDDEDGGVQLT
jgi:hypothetical protein